ncbi:MAG: IS5 family transposase ISMac11 [Rhodothermaceae bacterium]|nr:MAG: IS5 family transposase ISMac11 [Rhodothermaceae bacterium]GIV60850.1 MAG: IS5 family transposase ISMac11 [Rhodothermaceae bacterium]
MTQDKDDFGVDPNFLPPESLWLAIEPLLPEPKPRPRGGRPPMPNRTAFFAIFYVLRTGIPWKALPRSLGAPSTVHDRFQAWRQAGVFERLWATGLLEYNTAIGLDFEWLSLDGCITKAPLGGEATGRNPTDRGKRGTKRHLLTEAAGIPIGLVVTGANRHDKTQVEAVFEAMPVMPPLPTREQPQHFCADRGYDYDDVRAMIGLWQMHDHIMSRGEERAASARQLSVEAPHFRARRWVCERTHSWMNRFRRLLVRWEKKLDNFMAFLHLACAFIVWRNCPVFG